VCLAFVRFDPSSTWPVLLASVRDEDLSRPSAGPAPWWPDSHPGALGGRDLRSGGTWLVVDPAARSFAAVFTPGAPTPDGAGLRSRGELPLLALADPTLGSVDPAGYEPFALLRADAASGALTWWTWDRATLGRAQVAPGLHVANISGLDATADSARQARWVGPFDAAVPDPFDPGGGPRDRWRGWVALFDDALQTGRVDALLGRQVTERGSYGTRSAALVALPAEPGAGPVFDWSPTPWDGSSWQVAGAQDQGSGRDG
jgi:Transport and Golgi organisation 2